MGSIKPEVKKPCVECYYMIGDPSKGTDRVTCMHPHHVSYVANLITGDVKEDHPSCEAMRAGDCGEQGKLWIYRKTKPAEVNS